MATFPFVFILGRHERTETVYSARQSSVVKVSRWLNARRSIFVRLNKYAPPETAANTRKMGVTKPMRSKCFATRNTPAPMPIKMPCATMPMSIVTPANFFLHREFLLGPVGIVRDQGFRPVGELHEFE